MRPSARIYLCLALACCLSDPAAAQGEAISSMDAPLTADAINQAQLGFESSLQDRLFIDTVSTTANADLLPNASVVRLQILLDQHGISPGVVDGFDGENVRKAITAVQQMYNLPLDGQLSDEVLAAVETGAQVIGTYLVTAEDEAGVVAPIPSDYAEMAQLEFLGYESVPEALSERFHMDIDLLRTLNPDASFRAGETILVAITGENREGQATQIIADKTMRQVRAYDAEGRLLAAYPATIGSEDNPSPTGTYTVEQATPMPNYTYNPRINFQQGENTEVLTIPPGPNGPVGSMWIALSKPTYGIHGSPEPSLIDKTGSHGCIRLTNWDAEELATMVQAGVTVTFL